MKSYSVWRMTSLRQRHRTFLMVLLSILMMLISFFSTFVRFLPNNDRVNQFQIGQSHNESINAKVVSAGDYLVTDLRQVTERITEEVQRKVSRSTKKAIRQYINNLPQGYQVPRGLNESVELTLTRNISSSIGQTFKNSNTLANDYALKKREYLNPVSQK